MRNIDNGNTLGLETTYQREELCGFLTRQVGCGFIEDEEPRATRRSASGGNQLLLADGKGGEQRGGRQLKADVVENFLSFAHHFSVLQQSKAHFLVAEEEIGGDREMRAKHDFLVHGVDAVIDGLMRRRERNRLAFPVYFATRAHMDSCKHLDERRLTGTVLADNRMDFARLEFKINGLQGVGGAETLVELFEHEKRRAGPASSITVAALLGLVHRRLLVYPVLRWSC